MVHLATLLTNLTRIVNIMTIGKKIASLFKKKEKEQILTVTDKVTDAIELGDKIQNDMETMGRILQAIPEREKGENLLDVLEAHGLEKDTFDQMSKWNDQARFGFSSFNDELKILLREKMSEAQRRDRIKHAPQRKKKGKKWIQKRK